MKIVPIVSSLCLAVALTACTTAPRTESSAMAPATPAPSAAPAAPATRPAPAAANAPRAARPPLVTHVYNWNDMPVQNAAPGPRRALFDQPTATLSNLECHITTLNPGQISHPPHTHPHEEMMLVKEGNIEAIVNGVVIPMPTGSVLFVAPGDLHGLRNTGTVPATYFVLTWRTPLTAVPDVTRTPTAAPRPAP